MRAFAPSLFTFFLICGCVVQPGPPADAGIDAGKLGDEDAGDAGEDAGEDAGPPDAGPPDAGPPDAGQRDAGWIPVLGPGPDARWGHVAVFDLNRKRMVMGFGAGTNGNFADLWELPFGTRIWHQLAPSGDAGVPAERFTAAAITDPAHDRLVLVGGYVTDSTDEVWSLSLGDLTWSRLPSGPLKRFDLAATTDGTRGWFFGGFTGNFSSGLIALNDLWELDLATNTWRELAGTGPRPAPTSNLAMGYFGGALYLTGGHDETKLTPETWRYDLSLSIWTQLFPSGTPAARAHFAYASDTACGTMVLAGGDNDDNVDVGTTEQFTFTTSPRFVRLPTHTPIPARRHAVLTIDPVSRTLALFGGNSDPVLLTDTWMFELGACP